MTLQSKYSKYSFWNCTAQKLRPYEVEKHRQKSSDPLLCTANENGRDYLAKYYIISYAFIRQTDCM